MTALLDHLEEKRAGGRKLLVPYLVAGIPDRQSFPDALSAVAEHADAVEVGLPFSDPLMDGPLIAAAAERAIAGGVGPLQALELIGDLELGTPALAMTYYNPIHRTGERAFCNRARKAGISGLIVPDLPSEESHSLEEAASEAELAWTPLVSPTSSRARVAAITARATGFVYAVSTLGVTGTRDSLSERASSVARACKEATDVPVLVGIGISTPEQAVEAAADADGVVIGSTVVSRLLEEGSEAANRFLKEVRSALDAAYGS